MAVTLVNDVASVLGTPSVAVAAAVILAVAVANYFFSARLDAREPPVLYSRIPFIGHLISMIRLQANFLVVLSKHRMPIASLPILNGKLYAVWDPNLVQAVYRSKDVSFEPFVVDFAQRELGYDSEIDKIIRSPGMMPGFFKAVHDGMATKYVHSMNVHALRYIGQRLAAISGDEDLAIPNSYLFFRDLMTMATCEALYGPENPARTVPTFLDDIWIFHHDLPKLLLGIWPSVTATKALEARERLQAALGDYYGKGGAEHEDAAGITRYRVQLLQRFGIREGAQVGRLELALLHVSTSNAIPTLFWFMTYVFTRPKLVAQLQDEAAAAVEHEPGNVVTVNLDGLADKCPLLVSCYRETIRLVNNSIGNRKVMTDTTISDGKGHTYLLKEGTNIQLPGGALHQREDIWGSNVFDFDPARFMSQIDEPSSDSTKAKRSSYVPFGGGRHLCPGRNFAFAENLGLMLSLVLGFKVSPIDGDWAAFKAPALQRCSISTAICKPVNNGDDFGIRIGRREGWESTKWKYVSGDRQSA